MREKDFLRSLGATEAEVEELTAYNTRISDRETAAASRKLPLDDELFVPVWESYVSAAKFQGIWEVLRCNLVQLRFPVREGMSRSEDYKAVTLQVADPSRCAGAAGLSLEMPGQLEVSLHATPAGKVPLIITRHRADFVTLAQALAFKNEPRPIPDSMGAAIVTGYNNWDRVRRYRDRWQANHPGQPWEAEFRRIIPQKELYRDRFIILSDGPYSGVAAGELGLDEAEWRRLSLSIRREHEAAHYFTLRYFGSMRNNLIDEIIADYMGVSAAVGRYRADWFLHFVGLEDFPHYRKGGRLENYRGKQPLSEGAFRIVQLLVKRAAENLEAFDQEKSGAAGGLGHTAMMLALSGLTLVELAAENAKLNLRRALLECNTIVRERIEGRKVDKEDGPGRTMNKNGRDY